MGMTRIDGIEYEIGSPAHLQAVEKRDAAKDKEISALTKDRDQEKARADAEEARADKAEESLKDATDPEKLEELISDRVTLHTDAKKVLGSDYDPSGKTPREVMVEAIKKDSEDFDAEGRSDDYVSAYFAATVKNHSRADEGGNGLNAARDAASGGKRKDKQDSSDKDDRNDSDAARKRMQESNRDAWKRPLAFNKRAAQQ